MPAAFNDETFTYTIDGEEVSELAAKGASDSIARDAQARLSVLASRLENGQITLQEGYTEAKRAVKDLHIAEFALSRGGFEQVKDWSRAEAIIAEQWSGNDEFNGLRGFFEEIEAGRYGRNALGRPVYGGGPSFQQRLLSYAAAGRATYENERVAARMEAGELLESRRVLAFADHCDDCPAWAALGWMESNRMLANYAIGMAECGSHDNCIIETRRAAIDEANAIGWNALPAAIGKVAKVATPVAIGFLGLFQIARSNPALMRALLGLLLQALGGVKVGL